MARKFSSLKDLYATIWIKELDFAGCIMDREVHFK